MPLRLQSSAPRGHKPGTLALTASPAGLWSGLATDTSQYDADYTQTPGQGMFQSGTASARHEFAAEWTIGFVLEMDDASSGYLYRHTSSDSVTMRLDSSQVLFCEVNNANVLRLPIAGLDSSPEQHVVAWVSRANPGTTGASNALESFVYVVNLDTFLVQRARFTHPVPAWTSGTHYVGCSSSAGANAYNGLTFNYFCDRRFQTLTEIANDWIESWTAPATVADVEAPPLPLSRGSGLASVDEHYGPVPNWAARNASHTKRRTWSPLVNRTFRSQPIIGYQSHVDHPAYRYAPNSSQFLMMLGWLQVAPVPVGADRVFVRVQTRQWRIAGSVVTIGIRIYVMSRKPAGLEILGQGQQPMEHYHSSDEITRNDGAAGVGEWNATGVLPIPESASGLIYVCPAFIFDPDDNEANDANARLQIRALHVVPMRSADEDGGLPFGGFGG